MALFDAGTSGSGWDARYPQDGSSEASIAIDDASSETPEFSADAYWANDPPPPMCLEAGVAPIVPGGTPECPDDKNRQGCPCYQEGATAPCWPGYRRHRNRGVCHDGRTTCTRRNEFTFAWGACENYQLPTSDAGAGAAACMCFSKGQWKVSNLVPCLMSYGDQPRGSAGAASSIQSGTSLECPADLTLPTKPWSENTLNVDCAGHFRLCFAVKAGKADAPTPSDCTVAKVCTEGDYPQANLTQAFPALPAWLATSDAEKACAQKFDAEGGYGEMTVLGTSVECDDVGDGRGGERVFNRVPYCPSSCQTDPTAPGCQACGNGGDGTF